jgi:hypothetical protein
MAPLQSRQRPFVEFDAIDSGCEFAAVGMCNTSRPNEDSLLSEWTIGIISGQVAENHLDIMMIIWIITITFEMMKVNQR